MVVFSTLIALHPTDVVGTGITFNIFAQSFVGGASTVGIDTVQLTNGDLRAQYTDISASGSPGITTIANFGNNTTVDEDGAHVLFHINDVTNDRFELLEGIFMVDTEGETYFTLFGNIDDDSDADNPGIGTISANVDGSKYNVTYVPPVSTNVVVKTLVTSAAHIKGGVEELFNLNLVDTKVEGLKDLIQILRQMLEDHLVFSMVEIQFLSSHLMLVIH